MSRRKKSKRWPAPKPAKKSIMSPRAEMEALKQTRRKPDGIYFDDVKVRSDAVRRGRKD